MYKWLLRRAALQHPELDVNGSNGPFSALLRLRFLLQPSFSFHQNLGKRITVFGYFVWLVFFSVTFFVFVFLFRGALISVIYMGFL
jgi:hypothetical protein